MVLVWVHEPLDLWNITFCTRILWLINFQKIFILYCHNFKFTGDITSVSKKTGQTIVLYHYCCLSRFFWNRCYLLYFCSVPSVARGRQCDFRISKSRSKANNICFKKIESLKFQQFYLMKFDFFQSFNFDLKFLWNRPYFHYEKIMRFKNSPW